MDKKRKRNLIILLVLVGFGMVYNIYIAFKPSIQGEAKSNTDEIGNMSDAFNQAGISDTTLMELSQGNTEFQAFLDSADVILDSMNCNCPDKDKNKIDEEI